MIKSKYTSAITDYKNRWWELAPNCVAAYQAKGASSYDASKLNLVNSGLYNLAEVGGAVNWDIAIGWSGFAALSRCLDTGIAGVLSQTWSVVIRVSGIIDNNTVMLGAYTSGMNGVYIAYFTATGWQFLRLSGSIDAPGSGAATLAISGSDVFVNGVDVGNLSVTTTTVTRSPYIGAQHYTAATQFCKGSIQAVAFYSTAIPAQILALSNAMNAL